MVPARVLLVPAVASVVPRLWGSAMTVAGHCGMFCWPGQCCGGAKVGRGWLGSNAMSCRVRIWSRREPHGHGEPVAAEACLRLSVDDKQSSRRAGIHHDVREEILEMEQEHIKAQNRSPPSILCR